MPDESRWLLLVLSLPTRNSTARVRVWRALKALGCGVLRDGVYLLPDRDPARRAFFDLQQEVTGAGGSAHVLGVLSENEAQKRGLIGLFDRSSDYAYLLHQIQEMGRDLAEHEPAALIRAVQRLRKAFDAVSAIDYFPGPARAQAEAALAELEARARVLETPDEPHPVERPIARLDRRRFRGRVWATRKQPWVDRLASAWLIRRFIDPGARFLWLEKPADCPEDAVGFDFDGASFTHTGNRVTFEVLVASFGLESDPALARMGNLVHYLDVGGIPVAEAAGIQRLLEGLRRRARDDDALVRQVCPLFDGLYEAYRNP